MIQRVTRWILELIALIIIVIAIQLASVHANTILFIAQCVGQFLVLLLAIFIFQAEQVSLDKEIKGEDEHFNAIMSMTDKVAKLILIDRLVKAAYIEIENDMTERSEAEGSEAELSEGAKGNKVDSE